MRTALTSEMWDTINSAWIDLQEVWGKGTKTREDLTKFLRFVQETSLRFDGSAYRTMLRNDAYWFSRLGLHLERADNTARILDVKYHVLLPEEEHVGGPLDYYQWTSILRSVSALTAYHWVYRETLKPWLIADLLILNDSLPRSLASCYGNLVRNLDQIGVAYGRQGAVPAPRPRRPQSAGTQPHGRYLPARRPRVHPGIHCGQFAARRNHHQAISGLGASLAGSQRFGPSSSCACELPIRPATATSRRPPASFRSCG